VYYHGNLTHFVEIHPEAKYYYELQSSTLVFKFPVPERLDGIASTTRSVRATA
jgi:elongation factor 3